MMARERQRRERKLVRTRFILHFIHCGINCGINVANIYKTIRKSPLLKRVHY